MYCIFWYADSLYLLKCLSLSDLASANLDYPRLFHLLQTFKRLCQQKQVEACVGHYFDGYNRVKCIACTKNEADVK